MNNLPNNWKIPALAILAILLSIVSIGLIKTQKTQRSPSTPKVEVKEDKPAVSFSLKPSQKDVKPGEKILLGLFLSGADARDITAAEVKLNFDREKMTLVSAKAGNFFNNPIEVLFDINNASFSLIENPAGDNLLGGANVENALIEFTFKSMSKSKMPVTSEDFEISTDPQSVVFVSKKGAVSPVSAGAVYKVE